MKKILLILVAILFCSCLYAQNVEINLINCKINDNDQRKIEKLIAYERMFCNEIFETENNISVPVKINLYGKYKDYKIEKERYKAASNTGFYIPQINQSFIYKSGDFIAVALHEASHSIFQFNYPGAPRWINEGLAEFFETLDFDSEGNLYASPQSNRIKSIKAGLAFKDGERLKTFFRIYDRKFYGHDMSENYNTAYSVIYYFIKGKNTKVLKNIIKLTSQGNDTIKAIELVYGSFEIFEERYKRFYELHP